MKNDDPSPVALNESVTQEEITGLREQLGKLSMEKDVMAQQYQQYILRLNGQIRAMNSQVTFGLFLCFHIMYISSSLSFIIIFFI